MKNSTAPNKSLGQHWLYDEPTLDTICDSAELSPDDVVLEVGPGLGTLTKKLVERVDWVMAVEYDKELAYKLPKAVGAPNLRVVSEDILKFNFSHMPKDFKVVANIPYYLTSNLVRRLLEAENSPSVIVLLIQKEVAERIVAGPGKMSILTVSAQFYAETKLGIEVGAELFTPPPKVDSQVVILRRKPSTPEVDTKKFFKVVKAGFGEKRKKLCNSLAGGLGMEKSAVIQIISDLGWPETVRAQELSLDQWLTLYKVLEEKP